MEQLNEGEEKVLDKADLKSVFRNTGKQKMLKSSCENISEERKVNKGYFHVT